MEGESGRRALLAVLLWAPFLGGTAGDGAEDGRDDGFRGVTAGDDLLSRLGRAAWEAGESWLGPQPLRLVAEVRSWPHGVSGVPCSDMAGGGGGGCVSVRPLPESPHPRFSPQSLSATLWLVSSGISVALTTLCGIFGDLLAASGVSGEF